MPREHSDVVIDALRTVPLAHPVSLTVVDDLPPAPTCSAPKASWLVLLLSRYKAFSEGSNASTPRVTSKLVSLHLWPFLCRNGQVLMTLGGGCEFPLPGRPKGIDCSAIEGSEEVACVKGRCVVEACQSGFALVDGRRCEPLRA